MSLTLELLRQKLGYRICLFNKVFEPQDIRSVCPGGDSSPGMSQGMGGGRLPEDGARTQPQACSAPNPGLLWLNQIVSYYLGS